jgi:hypothetical protein
MKNNQKYFWYLILIDLYLSDLIDINYLDILKMAETYLDNQNQNNLINVTPLILLIKNIDENKFSDEISVVYNAQNSNYVSEKAEDKLIDSYLSELERFSISEIG